MFSKLRFLSKLRFFVKTKFFIVLNNAHVIYLLTTIAGSKKMNMMALMIKMVFICFMLHVSLHSNYSVGYCFWWSLSLGYQIMAIPVWDQFGHNSGRLFPLSISS